MTAWITGSSPEMTSFGSDSLRALQPNSLNRTAAGSTRVPSARSLPPSRARRREVISLGFPASRRCATVSFLPADPSESENAKGGEYDGGGDADRPHRQPVGNPVADQYGGNIRQDHAERCADDDRVKGPNRAARPIVAIWVLSPISARKKAQSVDRNAPVRLIPLSSPSYLSGNSAHTATPRKEIPRIQRIHGPLNRCRRDRRRHGLRA